MMIRPFRVVALQKLMTSTPKQILDIGSGSHSPTITKRFFPGCTYSGVDIQQDYSNTEEDIQNMDQFFEMDLTKLNFEAIPNNTYDLIVMSHIIEHLHNGDKVIAGLLPKLKSGGVIYIEFPSEKSTKLPSMPETLNFYDDPTHVRIFTRKEITELLSTNGLEVIEQGIAKRLINILLLPIRIPFHLIKLKRLRGPAFWDLYGFAEYVIGKKKG